MPKSGIFDVRLRGQIYELSPMEGLPEKSMYKSCSILPILRRYFETLPLSDRKMPQGHVDS